MYVSMYVALRNHHLKLNKTLYEYYCRVHIFTPVDVKQKYRINKRCFKTPFLTSFNLKSILGNSTKLCAYIRNMIKFIFISLSPKR